MFQMFTDAGNAAVAEIVRNTMECAEYEDRKTSYDRICAELKKLQTIEAFAEATDTAVREAVWDAVWAALPEPVFKSCRA